MIALLAGCKQIVEIPSPITQLVTSSVFNNNASATSAQTVIYSQMVNNGESWQISQNSGLLSDELTNYSTNIGQVQFYDNALSAASTSGRWNYIYNYIYQANAVISGLQNNSGVSVVIQHQLIGESKFIRAFWYFYLTNMYGDVPLVISTDYTINASITRTPKQQVYEQIITDLKDAQNLLNNNYVDASDTTITTDRGRPTKWAASALLARTYLYTGRYDSAESKATAVINNTGLYSLDSLKDVFLANSTEAIWQLDIPLPTNYNTPDGYNFILSAAPGMGLGNSTTISTQLLNSFEPGDNRKSTWIGSFTADSINYYYFPYKYKVYQSSTVTEYVMALRLAEQYLIRAEAKAQQGNITGSIGALADLNIIRKRAGLKDYSGATDQTSVLNSILHERQVELFTEWGHRWFDMIRTDNANNIMSIVTPQKGGTWNLDGYQTLYPIPQSERNLDRNLSQNEGY